MKPQFFWKNYLTIINSIVWYIKINGVKRRMNIIFKPGGVAGDPFLTEKMKMRIGF